MSQFEILISIALIFIGALAIIGIIGAAYLVIYVINDLISENMSKKEYETIRGNNEED